MFRDGTILNFEGYLIKELLFSDFTQFVKDNLEIFEKDPYPNFKDYYLNDAKSDHDQLLTTAYTIHLDHDNSLIGYFSLSNVHMKADPSILGSNYLSYYYLPAVYFQNFSILPTQRNRGHGSNVLSILKARLIFNSISAARLIIADSLEKSKQFYEDNGFEILGDDAEYPMELPVEYDTTRMYFDLLDLKE